MISADDFHIATMSRDEVGFAIELAAKEGWNPGLHDAASFFAADNEGFLIGRLNGEPIGCISAVRYPGNLGFIGLYLVVPEQRGKGYGIRLWNAAMERLAGCNIGLDGVLAQQANYQRSGFKLLYSNIRFESVDAPRAAPAGGLVKLQDVPMSRVLEYDRIAFPAPREAFLQSWLAQPDSAALAALTGDRLAGYGVIRKCLSGWKIGPLFADDAETAGRIYLALCAGRDNDEAVYLDVPEVKRRRDGAGAHASNARGLRHRADGHRPGAAGRAQPRIRRHHLRTGLNPAGARYGNEAVERRQSARRGL